MAPIADGRAKRDSWIGRAAWPSSRRRWTGNCSCGTNIGNAARRWVGAYANTIKRRRGSADGWPGRNDRCPCVANLRCLGRLAELAAKLPIVRQFQFFDHTGCQPPLTDAFGQGLFRGHASGQWRQPRFRIPLVTDTNRQKRRDAARSGYRSGRAQRRSMPAPARPVRVPVAMPAKTARRDGIVLFRFSACDMEMWTFRVAG